jgi:hypothetical protein
MEAFASGGVKTVQKRRFENRAAAGADVRAQKWPAEWNRRRV